MDIDYEKHLNSCGLKKNHEVSIVVKEPSTESPQKGGSLLWSETNKGFGSIHAVLKVIYEALPQYRGRRVYVEIRNLTNGMITMCSSHYMPLNRIPLKL